MPVARATPEPTANAEEEGLLASNLDGTVALPTDLGQSGFDVVPEGAEVAGTRASG